MISKANIKQIRSLQQKKFRDQLEAFVLEGHKLLQEAIQHAPDQIETIYTTSPESLSDLTNVSVVQINEIELSQISSLRSPQPYVTICKKKKASITESPLELVLDTIQDPGNMGTILRLAAWFGIRKIVISERCVDIYNPKVIQASMGAIFTVDVEEANLSTYLAHSNKPIYGALMDGKNVYRETLSDEAILLMGNEGNGISDSLIGFITDPIAVPRFGTGESLNVAMATGILLSEFSRNN